MTKMLARDSRNFHGWGYRRTVVSELEKLNAGAGDDNVKEVVEGEDQGKKESQTMIGGKGSSMVESEFDYTTRMIKTNLSNFSAWHARSVLIPRLLSERNASDEDRIAMLDSGK